MNALRLDIHVAGHAFGITVMGVSDLLPYKSVADAIALSLDCLPLWFEEYDAIRAELAVGRRRFVAEYPMRELSRLTDKEVAAKITQAICGHVTEWLMGGPRT